MADRLEDRVRAAAPRPRAPLPTPDVWQRGLRLRRRRAASGAMAVVLLAALVGAGVLSALREPQVDLAGGAAVSVLDRPAGPADVLPDGAIEADGDLVAARLARQEAGRSAYVARTDREELCLHVVLDGPGMASTTCAPGAALGRWGVIPLTTTSEEGTLYSGIVADGYTAAVTPEGRWPIIGNILFIDGPLPPAVDLVGDAGTRRVVVAADASRLPLPAVGEVRPDRLDDGTAVFVVAAADGDGDVRVLEAESPLSRQRDVAVLTGWCEGRQAFVDAYYGSWFDRAGHWTGGPAATGLTPREVRVEDGQVVVGPPLPPPERDDPSPAGGLRTDGEPCTDETAAPGDLLRHDDGGAVRRPEDVRDRSVATPVPVIGSLERLGTGELRLCSDRPASPTGGPVCPADAPPVDPAEFEWADPSSAPTLEPGQSTGAYGIYLVTAVEGRLRLHAVLPQLFPFSGDTTEGGSFFERTGELRAFSEGDSALADARPGEPPAYVLTEPDGTRRAIYPDEDLAVYGGPRLADVDGAGMPSTRDRLDRALAEEALRVTVTVRRRDGAAISISEDP